MQKHLQRCDCVIEVHDSRIPHLGRNPKFDLLQSKPRVVVMNKTDLASKKGKTGGVKRKRKRYDAPASEHPAFAAAGGTSAGRGAATRVPPQPSARPTSLAAVAEAHNASHPLLDNVGSGADTNGDTSNDAAAKTSWCYSEDDDANGDELDDTDRRHIARGWGDDDEEVIMTNCRKQQCAGVLQILPKVLEMVDEAALSRETPYLRLMVVGIPNVGKSSLINALRRSYSGRGKAARTGNNPGVTRALQTDIKINDVPPVYLVDTPGVMIPNVETAEVAMKLALLGTLRDDLVGEETIADFLLYTLNQEAQFGYVDRFGLDGPCDDIDVVLPAVGKRIGALLKGGQADTLRAAQHMLIKYREGNLGKFRLNPAAPLLPEERGSNTLVDVHAAHRPAGFAPDNA